MDCMTSRMVLVGRNGGPAAGAAAGAGGDDPQPPKKAAATSNRLSPDTRMQSLPALRIRLDQLPVPRYGSIRPQYRTANQLKRETAPITFIDVEVSASGCIANAWTARRVSKNNALPPAIPRKATFVHHTALPRYR